VRFAREGAAVLVADIDTDRSANVTDEIRDSGGAASYAKLDVRKQSDAADMVATAVAEYGHLDVLVNNVGGSMGDDMLGDLDEETWDFNFTFSLKPTFFCTKAALPELLKRTDDRPHAAIVNLSSLTGLTGMGLPAYAAAKAGVVQFTQNLAIQYGSRGVRANVIAPGATITGNWTLAFAADPGLHDRLAALYPVKRLGDIANAALYLASDEATFVNGTTLVVDGGYMAGNDSFIKASVGEHDTHDLWGRETGNA
jgi:NAD(P)-dependent dehydrogenase (short-subunit alcohol dehydrogenase family)